MARNRDKTGEILNEGDAVTLDIEGTELKGTVIGLHEDGVHVAAEDGARYALIAADGRDVITEVTKA